MIQISINRMHIGNFLKSINLSTVPTGAVVCIVKTRGDKGWDQTIQI
jgi:hypothetical protein